MWFDSAASDALVAAKATLDSARAQQQAGTLPQSLASATDVLSIAYDTAYSAWEAWKADVQCKSPNVPATLITLNQTIAALNRAMATYR